MRILLSGSSGFIGSAISKELRSKDHIIIPISRENLQNPSSINVQEYEGADAVIHLAGENVAGRLWTKKQMERIRGSRIAGTANLVQVLKNLKQPPKTFICASAMGYYEEGDHLDENSPPGMSFLGQVCVDWENASLSLRDLGIRTVYLRFGHVLGKHGASLKPLVLATRFFMGAVLGSGSQLMSWIGIKDAVRSVEWILEHPELSGPFNLVSPKPVTQKQFMKTLGQVLNRPIFLRIPAWFLKLCLGKMAKELLLASLGIFPKNLLDSGFEFQEEELDKALRLELDS